MDKSANPMATGLLWGVNVLGLGVLLTVFMTVVPRFETLFADFDIELPGLTVIVLRMTAQPILAVGLVAMILLVEVVLYVAVPPARVAVLMAFSLLTVLLILAVGLAVLMPMLHMVNSVSGP